MPKSLLILYKQKSAKFYNLARNPSILQGSTELLAHVPASHVEAGIFCGRFVSMQHKDAKLRIVDV